MNIKIIKKFTWSKCSFVPSKAIALTMLCSSVTVFQAHAVNKEHSADDLQLLNNVAQQDCVIEPSDIVDVGSPISGLIDELFVTRSGQVKKGQQLAKLESSVEKAALQLALTKANQNTAVELHQQQVKFVELTRKRKLTLHSQSLISKQEMDDLSKQTRIAELELQYQQDNKQLAWLEFLKAKSLLARNIIVSPIDGVVVDKYMSVGEYVERKPILRLAQLNPLHVEVILPVKYYGMVKEGMYGEVLPFLDSETPYYAKVELVDPVIDAASSTFGVRLVLDNPDHKIPAGMRCKINFMEGVIETNSPTSYAANESTNIDNEATTELVADVSQLPTSTVVPQVDASQQMCYQIGSFKNAKQSLVIKEQISSGLQSLAIKHSLQTKQTSTSKDFYMLLQKSTLTRKEFTSKLANQGISDYYILSGKSSNLVASLGFFQELKSAESTQKNLQSKGVTSEIVIRDKTIINHWLELAVESKEPVIETQDMISSLLPEKYRVMSNPCVETYSLN